MAIVTISISLDTTAAPNVAVLLQQEAQEWMSRQLIDFSGMTQAQKIKTYIIGILKEAVKQRQQTASAVTVQTTINTAVTSIQTEANNGLA